MTQKVVVLLSGGLDSSTCAFIARQDVGKTGKIIAISFMYGQRHEQKEIACAEKIAEAVGVEDYLTIPIPINEIVTSALTGNSEVPTEGKDEGIPTTWVPQRNSIFLALGYALAESKGADSVYIGVHHNDLADYPDCRPEFISHIELALNLASKKFIETGKGIDIRTPILRDSKAQIVLKGMELGVPFIDTWTCYQGEFEPCHQCDACRTRERAFELNGLVDPLNQ